MKCVVLLLLLVRSSGSSYVPSDWRLKGRCEHARKERSEESGIFGGIPINPLEEAPSPHGNIRPNAFIAACLARAGADVDTYITPSAEGTVSIATPSFSLHNNALPPSSSAIEVTSVADVHPDLRFSALEKLYTNGSTSDVVGFSLKEELVGGDVVSSGKRATQYLVFKGTTTGVELESDLRIQIVPWPTAWLTPAQRKNTTFTAFRAHSGFLERYSKVRIEVLRRLRTSIAERNNIEIVGHGTGGALASLALMDAYFLGLLDEGVSFGYQSDYQKPGDLPLELRSLGAYYQAAFPNVGLSTFGGASVSSAGITTLLAPLLKSNSRFVLVSANLVEDPVAVFPGAGLHIFYHHGVGAIYLCSQTLIYQTPLDWLRLHSPDSYVLHVLERVLSRSGGLGGIFHVQGAPLLSTRVAPASHYAVGWGKNVYQAHIGNASSVTPVEEPTGTDLLVTSTGYAALWVALCYFASLIYKAVSRRSSYTRL